MYYSSRSNRAMKGWLSDVPLVLLLLFSASQKAPVHSFNLSPTTPSIKCQTNKNRFSSINKRPPTSLYHRKYSSNRALSSMLPSRNNGLGYDWKLHGRKLQEENQKQTDVRWDIQQQQQQQKQKQQTPKRGSRSIYPKMDLGIKATKYSKSQLNYEPDDDFPLSPPQPPRKTTTTTAKSNNQSSKIQSKKDDEEDVEKSIQTMEKEIMSSVQAKMDIGQVRRTLRDPIPDPEDEYAIAMAPSQWSIAIAAGSMSGLVTFLAFHSTFMAIVGFSIVTFLASQDPFQEETDDISGPIARTVGRATLDSIEKSKPVVRAVARAAIKGESELDAYKAIIQDLEEENQELKLYIQKRRAADDILGRYSLDDLKWLAKDYKISSSGSKFDIVMRLINANYFQETMDKYSEF